MNHLNGRSICSCLVLLSLVTSLQVGASAKSEGSGTLTVDGETVRLDSIMVERFGSGMITVLISDRKLPSPCTALEVMVYAEKEPITGVLFSITEELELSPSSNAVYHPTLAAVSGYGALREGRIELERSDGMARGALRHTAEVEGREYTVDLTLAVPLDAGAPSIAPRTVTGADSKPAKAFVKLVDAVVALDVDAVMESVTAEAHEQLEPAPDAELLADFADFMLPLTMTITETEIDGDRAVVTVKGETPVCLGSETSEGRVDLVREKRTWKVSKVSWNG